MATRASQGRRSSQQLRRIAQRRAAAGQRAPQLDPPQTPSPPDPGDGSPRPDDADATPPSPPDPRTGDRERDWTRHIEVLGTAIGSTLTAIAAIAAVLISVVLNHNETATT